MQRIARRRRQPGCCGRQLKNGSRKLLLTMNEGIRVTPSFPLKHDFESTILDCHRNNIRSPAMNNTTLFGISQNQLPAGWSLITTPATEREGILPLEGWSTVTAPTQWCANDGSQNVLLSLRPPQQCLLESPGPGNLDTERRERCFIHPHQGELTKSLA
ncbi:Death-Inducer Obliterator 1 [Manis pentadactyla]|nr:Death-Inducer Obliterator 1 [Manis pentadactyla]